ncbi:amidase [Fusarium subglutinans]|uniref:Amidase n=1 Tax=Gibberella subglutinans TaxID=42677 RepID=A0A8H5V7V9_GIBSU|nr:amidase [Fusarium subglutinans]KAF5612408.1 amidase [Fusarium subglutinans]
MATHATYPSLRDKTVLITGGAEGIGAATVELFTLQGSQVIFIDIAEDSAKKTIDRAVSRAKDANVQAKAPIFYSCSVSDLPRLQDTVKRIQDQHGMIHILVNNAAAAGNRARLETENVRPEDWEANINTNLRHVFFMSQAVLPAMREAKTGSIVNLGSITWRIPAQGTPVYGTCKAAIMGLTRTQSKEYGKYNVRINSVMPGAIATQRQRDEVLTPEYREEVMRGQSLQRDLEPEEVAKVVVFLGSDEASGVTGSSYVVDGDMPTEHGSTIYKNDHPVIDAGSVMVLRQAGCLIFGKTTTTEFAASFTGPATRNAHSISHTPGGSSAGSAAAVADFQIPIALGSQTVGSIVRPAAFNGIYGFKPTWGAITREGQKFCAPTVDTIGFFSRSVSDLEILSDIFALHDDEISTFALYDEESDTFGSIKGLKFAVCRTSKWELAGEGTIAAMDKAVELLKAHGAEVEELDLGPDFEQVIDWHFTLVRLEGATSLWPEYCQDKGKLDPVLAKGVRERHKISRKAQLDAYDGLAALRPRFDTIVAKYAAVLAPSVFDEAPEGLGNTGSPVFAATWTALHTPVVNIPGFRGKSNLPVGVSLVSARLRDRHLLKVSEAVGHIFEAEGGWNKQSRSG